MYEHNKSINTSKRNKLGNKTINIKNTLSTIINDYSRERVFYDTVTLKFKCDALTL